MGILEMTLPNEPLGWFLYIVAGTIIVYSWVCCGRDHKEDVIK